MPLQLNHIEFQGEYFPHYYLCNYRPRHTGSDELSESLIRFKEFVRLDVEAWTECALLELHKISFNNTPVILRALASDEKEVTTDSQNALDWLASKVASELNGFYKPGKLRKSRATKSVKLLTKMEREKELEDVYYVKGILENDIIIIDDILTTGTTMKEIIRAIRAVLPSSNIKLFTLADTDHQAVLNQQVSLAGYSYKWEEEEWQTLEEAETFYTDLERLKSQILNDSFD